MKRFCVSANRLLAEKANKLTGRQTYSIFANLCLLVTPAIL